MSLCKTSTTGVSNGAARRKRWADRLTIPATVVFALFVLKLATPMNYDPDLYWHLKTGEYILQHGALPYTDVFSHTMYGENWVLHEWLSQVIFHAIVSTAGFGGLNLFVAALYALTFYVLFRLCARMAGTETKGLIVALLFYAPLLGFTSPRPQLFTYLFFAVYLAVLFDYKYYARTRMAPLLPAIMLFWANLHAASVVGIALLVLFIAAEWATVCLHREQDPARRKALRTITTWGLLAAAATLANPRVLEYWIYPFYVLNLDVAKGVINEWRSPNFHSLYYRYFLGLFLLFFAVHIYARKKPDLTELIVPVFFIVAGFTAVRHLPLACLTAAPFLALFANHLPPLGALERLRTRRKGASRDLPPALVGGLNMALLLCVAAAIGYKQSRLSAEEIVHWALPVKAAEFVAEKGITGRMFNEYGEGGYLIYRLHPGNQVFVDGRADLYGNAFLDEYFQIVNGRAGWRRQFEARAIDYAVLPREVPLRQLLLAHGEFKLVYDDARHSVLVRDTERFSHLPAVRSHEESTAEAGEGGRSQQWPVASAGD